MKIEQIPVADQVGEQKRDIHPLPDLQFESWAEVINLESKKQQELVELKEWLETSEPYQEYLKQPLTFKRLDGVLEEYRYLTENNKDKEVVDLEDLLAGEIENIKSKVDDYYTSILRIQRHSQPMVKMRSDDRVWAEKFSSLDHLRRNTHNALLVALRSLYRICTELIPKRTEESVSVLGLFDLKQLTDENRTIAGEWAYNAAFAERIKKQIEKIDQKLNEK